MSGHVVKKRTFRLLKRAWFGCKIIPQNVQGTADFESYCPPIQHKFMLTNAMYLSEGPQM